MSKPKNKPNAFSAFCQEWRKKEEKKNRHFTMAEAISNPECNQAWRDMSEDQKARYKTIAKNTKFPVESDKKTGLGESVSEIERAQRKKKEYIDNMKDFITSVTRGAKEHNCIQKLTFYVIHTNYMFNRTLDNNEIEYYPAEICVARCSLENGVEDVHHVLVSEPVLKGYRNDAITHSKDTHQIPIDFEDGVRSYQEIFADLCKFLEPGKKNNVLPPLYTIWAKDDIYYPAKSILGRLAEASDKYEEYLRLYSFEELFASMYNAVLEQSGTMDFESITALREIKKDPYAYKHGLECEFHKAIEAGALYCSQSIVKRWFYVLCDFCCDHLEIVKIPGVHTPIEKKVPILPMSKLNSSMSTMSLSESRCNSSTLNMSNASSYCARMRSSRTVQEEERRKAESKPITIIDHSKIVKKLPEVKERPLRAPYSKSTLIDDDTVDSDSIDTSESSFPSIGRGSVGRRKRSDENKGAAGHGGGYAGALKK